MNQTTSMEKNCLRISVSERNIKDINTSKVRTSPKSWDHYNNNSNNNIKDNGDLLASGFSWPPRSYTCSFCRRDFRSAQALGGHMNVHRRDRARLCQQSPPPPPARDNINGGHSPLLNLNLDPNPNPNPNPSYSPSRKFPFCNNPTFFPFVTSSSSLPLASSCCGSFAEMAAAKGSKAQESIGNKNGVFKKEIVRLELEIGLKEDLDLELRLGCNT